MRSPVLLTPLYREKTEEGGYQVGSIRRGREGGGAQREDRKRAEAMGATQNLFKGNWDKTTFRNKGDWIERLRRGGEEQRVKLQPRNSL